LDKLRIVLCDDNAAEAEKCYSLCREICTALEAAAEFKVYTSVHELLFDMDSTAFTALVNIFIIEPEGAFCALPGKLRKQGYDGIILYYSCATTMERYHQAFDYGAYNFLQKGADHTTISRFRAVFERCLRAVDDLERQVIVLACAGEYKQIPIKEIRYFEAAFDHTVSVVYGSERFRFPSTLRSLEERLRDRGFVRTHRSYIVAIDSILQLEPSELTLKGGDRIPVSRSYYSSLKATIERWRL